jgi:hypothetical protein
MTELRRTRNEPHCQTQEEELEARRILLAGARKGDRKAKTELMESYGVKIYSEAERKRTKVVEPLMPSKQKARQQSRTASLIAPGSSGGPSGKVGRKSF